MSILILDHVMPLLEHIMSIFDHIMYKGPHHVQTWLLHVQITISCPNLLCKSADIWCEDLWFDISSLTLPRQHGPNSFWRSHYWGANVPRLNWAQCSRQLQWSLSSDPIGHTAFSPSVWCTYLLMNMHGPWPLELVLEFSSSGESCRRVEFIIIPVCHQLFFWYLENSLLKASGSATYGVFSVLCSWTNSLSFCITWSWTFIRMFGVSLFTFWKWLWSVQLCFEFFLQEMKISVVSFVVNM